jgi:hypothetical protein
VTHMVACGHRLEEEEYYQEYSRADTPADRQVHFLVYLGTANHLLVECLLAPVAGLMTGTMRKMWMGGSCPLVGIHYDMAEARLVGSEA